MKSGPETTDFYFMFLLANCVEWAEVLKVPDLRQELWFTSPFLIAELEKKAAKSGKT